MEILNTDPGQRVWVPVAANAANTVYEGSIVTLGTDGVVALGQAAGAYDTTGKDGTPSTAGIPFGLVLGTSRRWESYNSTQKRDQITSIITTNANFYPTGAEMAGLEGGWGMDKQAYVYVERIFPHTILRAPIYFTSLGTAPTVNATTVGSATGVGYTTATFGFTSVQYNTSSYCRTGANRGIYRVTTNGAHATVFTFTSPWPAAVAVGDTFTHVNIRTHGTSRIQLDSTSSFVLGDAALTGDYFEADVVRLDLSEAGREYVNFRFGAFAFMPALA